jgi:hypothetical protein
MGMDPYREGEPREITHEFRFRPPVRWGLAALMSILAGLFGWADEYAVFSPNDQVRIDCSRAENICVVALDHTELARIPTENLESAAQQEQHIRSLKSIRGWTDYYYTGQTEPQQVELPDAPNEDISKVIVGFAHSNASELHTQAPAHSRIKAAAFFTPLFLFCLFAFLTALPWSSYRLRYSREGAELHIETVRRRFFRQRVSEFVVPFSDELILRRTAYGLRLHSPDEDRMLLEFPNSSGPETEEIRKDFISFMSNVKDR